MSESNEKSNSAEGAGFIQGGANTVSGINPPTETRTSAISAKGVYVHRFKKPFEYAGKKYETLNFYFERLTGRDMIAIETEMQANSEYALDPLLSRSFQSKMASRAGNIGSDVLEALPINSFNEITNAARNFLLTSLGE